MLIYLRLNPVNHRKNGKQKGWIHPDDPRGWFEWYCKYFLGRRHEDDERQIKDGAAFCGPKGRWRNIIYSKIHADGCDVEFSEQVQEYNNPFCIGLTWLIGWIILLGCNRRDIKILPNELSEFVVILQES